MGPVGRPPRGLTAAGLAVPGVEQRVDVLPLRTGERGAGEEAPRLDRVVVRDCRLEVLAARQRLAQLAAEPAEQADAGRIHSAFLQGYRRRCHRLWAVEHLSLIEFPADDLPRARRFWAGLLGRELADRSPGEGSGVQTHSGSPELGVHERGPGPGDRFSLPYFHTEDLAAALARVVELGGSVVHPGERFAVCRDSEGNPFGLAG